MIQILSILSAQNHLLHHQWLRKRLKLLHEITSFQKSLGYLSDNVVPRYPFTLQGILGARVEYSGHTARNPGSKSGVQWTNCKESWEQEWSTVEVKAKWKSPMEMKYQ